MRGITVTFVSSSFDPTDPLSNPNELLIPNGGTGTLEVTITGTFEGGDAGRKVNAQLHDADFGPDDFLDSASTTLPTDKRVGDPVTLTFIFRLSCVALPNSPVNCL